MNDVLELIGKFTESENVAVIDHEKSWTYREFLGQVFLARDIFLVNDIKKVVVGLPQGVDAYALIWGAYLSGTVFCPVHADLPFERKNYYVRQFQPDLFIELENTIYEGSIQSLDAVSFFKQPLADHIPIRKIVPEDDAYVIFTSGSTGLPKGAIILRKGLENYLNWSLSEYNVSPGELWGQYTSLGFDIGLCDVFEGILSGATLIPIVSKGEKLLPGLKIRNSGINIWNSVPSAIDLMKKSGHLKSEFIGSLRKVILGGEQLFPEQLTVLFDANPDLIIYNTYGPTEVTIMCTFQKFTKDDYKKFCSGTASIGKALPGYEIVLIPADKETGEIVSVSDFNARGYLGEEGAKNAFKVYDDGKTVRKAYHTGDYARQENGLLFFSGRHDAQVKVMGVRIDMQEIDHQLRSFGCVAAQTVLHQNRLISFVEVEEFNEQDIKDYLRGMLPPTHLPSQIILVTQFPLSANGKTDINRLIAELTL